MPRPFNFKILLADANHIGEELRKQQVAIDCVFTSPPYLGQRQYGNSRAEVGRPGNVQAYAERLARIFSSLPLREGGSIWVNLDDVRGTDGRLLRLPQRLEGAMEERGWFVADRITWVKAVVEPSGRSVGSCMPESIGRWRCGDNATESVTRFVRSQLAWNDLCAVGIPRASCEEGNIKRYLPESLMRATTDVQGRLRINAWRINISKSRDALNAKVALHYAVEVRTGRELGHVGEPTGSDMPPHPPRHADRASSPTALRADRHCSAQRAAPSGTNGCVRRPEWRPDLTRFRRKSLPHNDVSFVWRPS